MNKREYFSILTLALVGVMCGTTQAVAYPLLDSDLASSTVLGTSKATRPSTGPLGQNGGNGSGGGTQAISGRSASPAAAMPGSQMAEWSGPGQAGLSFAQWAPESPERGAPLINPAPDEPILPPGGPDFAPEPEEPDHGPGTPTPDDDKIPNDVPDFITPPDSVSVPAPLANDDSSRSVPEPATLLLLGAGLAGLGFSRRRYS